METYGAITRRAYAKVNLILSVGAPIPQGSQDEGMHPISSWMACIDLSDTLEVSRRPDGEASTYSIAWSDVASAPIAIDWPLDKDLAVRAHQLLEEVVGRPLPIDLRLAKSIPVGGGLGGGSSDAAAALQAIRQLFGLDIADSQLAQLGARLGSDVPFFLDGDHNPPRPAIVDGLGNQVQRVQRVTGEVALVMPGFECPTGAVYRAFDEYLSERLHREELERAAAGKSGRERQTGARPTLVRSRYEKALAAGRLEGSLLFNDLAVPAFRVQPPLGRLVTALANVTREPAHVSGSGSSLFLVAPRGREQRLMERVTRLLESLATGEDESLRPVRARARLVPLV